MLAPIAETQPTRAEWLKKLLPRLAAVETLAPPVLAGHVALASGWAATAAALFEAALKLDPGQPALLDALARAQLDAGQPAPALATADALARLCPGAGTPLVLKAKALDAQGKPDAVADACRQALPRLDKPDLAAWRYVAGHLSKTPRVDEAIAAWRAVVALDPADAAAANSLAWLYASHKPDQLGEAEKLAQAAAKAAPRVAGYLDTLGWVHYLRRDYDGARSALEAALALAPTRAACVYHFGMVNFAQGRRDRAQRALQTALRLDPNLPEASTANATLELIEQQKLETPGLPRVP